MPGAATGDAGEHGHIIPSGLIRDLFAISLDEHRADDCKHRITKREHHALASVLSQKFVT